MGLPLKSFLLYSNLQKRDPEQAKRDHEALVAKARAEMAASMGKPNRPTMREKTETSLTMALSRDGKKVRPHSWDTLRCPQARYHPADAPLPADTSLLATPYWCCVLSGRPQCAVHMAEVPVGVAGVCGSDVDPGVPGCRGGQLARGRRGHPRAHRYSAGSEAGHQVLLPLAHT